MFGLSSQFLYFISKLSTNWPLANILSIFNWKGQKNIFIYFPCAYNCMGSRSYQQSRTMHLEPTVWGTARDGLHIGQYNTHHMLYMDEIPFDHVRSRQMFVCVFHTQCKQLQTYTWNCQLLYNFNIIIPQFFLLTSFLYILKF